MNAQALPNEGRFLIFLRFGVFVVMLPVLGLYIFEPSWMSWAIVPLPAAVRGLGAVIALPMIPAIREDAMMLERFGEAYREYMARTGQLIPRF